MSAEIDKDIEQIKEQFSMLVKTNRMGNLVDLLSVISDNIEMMNDDMVEKAIKKVDGAATAAFIGENSIKYAKKELQKGNEYGSIFQIMGAMKDPDIKKGISFTLHMLKGLGKQL